MKQFRGFTLVEIIAIIIVIIILAAAALPRIGNMREKATNAANADSIANVSGALERAVTEGTLTSNNAANAYNVLCYTNSINHVPYLASAPSNIFILAGNWPQFTVMITNGVAGSGGINATNNAGNTNSPAPGYGTVVLTGVYPDQLTWTYSGTDPVYWMVIRQADAAIPLDTSVLDWWDFPAIDAWVANPDGSARGVQTDDGTKGNFVFGIDNDGNVVVPPSNVVYPVDAPHSPPPPEDHGSDFVPPIAAAIGSANSLLDGHNGYYIYFTPYPFQDAVLGLGTTDPQTIINWANANAKPQYAHAAMPPNDLYILTFTIVPNSWYYEFAATYTDPTYGLITPTDLLINVTFIPTGHTYTFYMSTSGG